MLRLLHVNAVGAEQLPDAAAAVPPHCVGIVVHLARQYATMWQDFAKELDGRARIIDPSAATHRSSRATWAMGSELNAQFGSGGEMTRRRVRVDAGVLESSTLNGGHRAYHHGSWTALNCTSWAKS